MVYVFIILTDALCFTIENTLATKTRNVSWKQIIGVIENIRNFENQRKGSFEWTVSSVTSKHLKYELMMPFATPQIKLYIIRYIYIYYEYISMYQA